MITEPTFFPKEEDEVITDDDLQVLDETIWELEQQVNSLTQEKEGLVQELENVKSDEQKIAEALDSLWEHPILWPLNEKILKWEKVDIPNYLEEIVKKEVKTLPKTEEISNEPIWTEKEPNLWELLAKKNREQVQFLRSF